MRTVNYKEQDYDQIFMSMMTDAYQYGLLSTDEHFLDYIKNREDIENMYCLFLSVYANEHSKIFEEMTNIYNSNDLDKATGNDLDIIGSKFAISRPSARKSSVELLFSLVEPVEIDTTIPQGTIVSTGDGHSYYTVEEATIVGGQNSAKVQAMSSDSGYGSRVDKNTLIYHDLNNPNITVINPKGSGGGREAYNDDEYRELIRNWAYSHIKGTKEAYDLFFANYDGVDSYRLFPLWDGAGTLKIVIDPSDDWTLNDIQSKIKDNVQLIDDDVTVVGAIPRAIDIKINVNVDIDNAQFYNVDEREQIAEQVQKAIKLYIDGGYKRNGEYYTGLPISADFIPFQCGMFIAQEVPQVRSVDFRDTIKNIDNKILASDFSLVGGTDNTCYDKTTKKLYSDDTREFVSPLLYITNAERLETDNDGFELSFYKGDEKMNVNMSPISITNGQIYKLEGIDLYGTTLHIKAKNKDSASIGSITIYGTDSNDSDNSYNTHTRISDEEIAVCGNVEVVIQNDYVNDDYTVCY